ncbi:MAG: hypothetical protein AB2A00_11690 [Myxococcota bacterium]
MSMGTTRRRYLEDRIVYCANCDANRLLSSNASGPVCAVCQSIHWMYLPQALPQTLAARAVAPVAAAPGAVAAFIEKVVELSDARLRPIAEKVVELSSPRLRPVVG